jgi:hypothetical protein
VALLPLKSKGLPGLSSMSTTRATGIVAAPAEVSQAAPATALPPSVMPGMTGLSALGAPPQA